MCNNNDNDISFITIYLSEIYDAYCVSDLFESVFLFEFSKIIQFFDDIIHQRNWRIFKM